MPDKNGWISVNESYPNDERPCLVVNKVLDHREILIATHGIDDDIWITEDGNDCDYVSHWMDLPEFPNV